jgi:hypothetical protein
VSKYLLLIIGILVFGGALGFVAFKIKNPNLSQNTSNLDVVVADTETAAPANDVLYQDGSGFSFKYPENLRVSDVTPNDDTYYSLVDVRQGGKSLRISVKDGEFKVPSDASLVGAATLAGISAKQYTYKVNSEDTLATVAVQSGIVYLIEGPRDGGFWEDTQNTIVASFNVGNQASASTNSASSSTIDEGEEVVE